jgi:hypothetical protein
MNGEADLITVYRSADAGAEENAEAVRDLLAAQGLSPVLLDDDSPGVPEGAWEVRVPAPESAKAEELIANADLPEDDLVEPSASHELDMETVFSAPGGTTAELEAMSVQSVVEGAGIATVMVGDQVLPNLPFEVRVAKEHAEEAREIIEQAKESGPAAADEAATNDAAVGDTEAGERRK